MSQGENAYNNTVKANIDKAVNEVVNDLNTLNTTFATLGHGIPQVDAALGSAMDALSSMAQGLNAAQSLITQGQDILAQDREKLEQLAADNRFAMSLDTVLKNPPALGAFPIEVIPLFFQGVAPFLPFTYGVSALREAMAGLYGYTYVLDLLKLLAFVPFALVLGLYLRKPLLKFNEFYENQLKDTNLM